MTEHILHPPTTKKRPSPWAILAAFLLNLLFALILLYVNYLWQKEAEKIAEQNRAIPVELASQPPAAPQPQPQQQQKQAQKEAEKQPEKEKEPEKQPEKPPEKQPEKPPEKQPEKPPEKQKDMAKPAPPQLQQAQIKDKSSSNRQDAHNGANGDNVAIALGAGPLLSMKNPLDPSRGPEGSRGPIGEEMSQSEQDYVLSQILPYWKVDTHRPEGKGMVLEAIIEVNADGTFMHPLGRDDPWNPGGIIAGYAEMARLGYSYRRESLEGFLLALRLSQPIKVPPGGKFPKWMKLRFAFDDL